VPRLLPVFGELVRRLPGGVIPVVPVSAVVGERVRRAAAEWAVRPIVVEGVDGKHDAFAAASAALSKSGTSTLELALAGVPMAVTYRVNPMTAMVARRLIRVRYAAMVNLLAGRGLVPELLQEACNGPALAAVLETLGDPAVAAAQRAGFREIMAQLQAPMGLPSDAAAREVLEVLDQT